MEGVTEWSYDKVLELIAQFQQRPILWDMQCDGYKDRQKRHEATLEIAAHFNIEKDEIERKLKNLQSHFYREIKKEDESRSLTGIDPRGGVLIYRSKWFAYDAMKFLIDKKKRYHIRLDGKMPAKRQKLMAACVSKHADKNLEKCGDKMEDSSLRQDSDLMTRIKNENIESTINNFLYIDANQQNSLDNNEMDFFEEKPANIDNHDPIEFTSGSQMNEVQQQQSQHIVNFENNQPNEEELSSSCKQDAKTLMISKATIDYFLAEVKAHGSNDSELIFYRSLIPDIMKLSDKRRRQFKEIVLCVLNKLLDEEESSAHTTKT